MSEQVATIIQLINGEFDQRLFSGMARIMSLLEIDGPEVQKKLEHEHLRFVYENYSSKITDLIVKTKYPRHRVLNFINDYKKNKKKKNRNSDIYSDFLQDLYDLSLTYPNNEIPIHGKNSYTQCFQDSAINDNTFTSKSVLEAFIRNECVEKINKNKIRFLSTVAKKARGKSDLIRQFSNLVFRYSILQKNNHNQVDEELIMYDMAMVSKKVPKQNRLPCRRALFNHFRESTRIGQEIIDSYEDPTLDNEKELGFHTFAWD